MITNNIGPAEVHRIANGLHPRGYINVAGSIGLYIEYERHGDGYRYRLLRGLGMTHWQYGTAQDVAQTAADALTIRLEKIGPIE